MFTMIGGQTIGKTKADFYYREYGSMNSSKTLINFYQTTRRQIPENSIFLWVQLLYPKITVTLELPRPAWSGLGRKYWNTRTDAGYVGFPALHGS
jgi:hypothetical protein